MKKILGELHLVFFSEGISVYHSGAEFSRRMLSILFSMTGTLKPRRVFGKEKPLKSCLNRIERIPIERRHDSSSMKIEWQRSVRPN